jgi:hypothetical protein
MLTPGDGMVEQISLSSDGRQLFYATNAADIDRRHVWKGAAHAGGGSDPRKSAAIRVIRGRTRDPR